MKCIVKTVGAMEWYENRPELLKKASKMFMTRNGLDNLLSLLIFVVKVDEQVKENRPRKICSLSEKLPQVSRSFLYEIVAEQSNY